MELSYFCNCPFTINLLFFPQSKSNRKRELHHRYATRLYWPVISYDRLEYHYFVNSIKYFDSNDYSSYNKLIIPHRYLVQFSLKHNSFSKILTAIPVPDSVKSAPPEGWKELPNWAKKKTQ